MTCVIQIAKIILRAGVSLRGTKLIPMRGLNVILRYTDAVLIEGSKISLPMGIPWPADARYKANASALSTATPLPYWYIDTSTNYASESPCAAESLYQYAART
jgi:hypothetical protein